LVEAKGFVLFQRRRVSYCEDIALEISKIVLSFHAQREIVSVWRFSSLVLANYERLNLIYIISMSGKTVKSSLELSRAAVRDNLTSPAVT